MHKLSNKFLDYFLSYFSRHHSYSKLLKSARTFQPTQDELLANSPSMSVSHQ